MDNEKLKEIKDVLLTVKNDGFYELASPEALEHLAMHVVHLIDAILKYDEVSRD